MRLCRCIIRFIGYDNRENLKLFHQVSKCRTLSAAHLLQFDKLQIVLKKQRTGNVLGLVLYKIIAAIFAKIFNQFHGIYLTFVCIRFQVAAFSHFRDASIPISVRLKSTLPFKVEINFSLHPSQNLARLTCVVVTDSV